MEVIQRADHTSRVEARRRHAEAASCSEVAEELAARHVFHDHVQLGIVLKGPIPGAAGLTRIHMHAAVVLART